MYTIHFFCVRVSAKHTKKSHTLMIGVLAIAAGFGVLNRVLRLVRRKANPHRLTSNVHHAVAVPLAIRCITNLPRPKACTTIPSSIAMMKLSSGFFLYDVFVCRNTPVMIFHALGAGSVYWYANFTKKFHHSAASHMLWELSTPFVHYREHLVATGQKHTRKYKINGVAMMAVFFACRNVGGAFMFRNAIRQCKEVPNAVPIPAQIILKAVAISMNCLNAFWFSKMVRGAAKTFRNK